MSPAAPPLLAPRSLLEKWSYSLGLRSARGLTLPHFLGIGGQRCGTSWLWESLRRHPRIFATERKEIHYFDRDFHLSLEEYAAHFSRAKNRLRGDITPQYGILPRHRIRFIRKIMPDVRILLILRNPIDRAWSHARMHLGVRVGEDLELLPVESFLTYLASPYCRRRSDFATIIDNWTRHFPEEQFYFAFFEEIRERPGELLAGICRFLGVPALVGPDAAGAGRIVHPGPGREMPPECRALLERLHGPGIERLYERFGERVAAWRVPGARPR